MKRNFVVLFICMILFAAVLFLFRQASTPAAVISGRPSSSCTLILDAGHGGEDGGAVSAAGAKESDINLAVVLKLDQLLGFWGIPATLTRSDDRSIHDASATTLREKKISDLHNRAALAESISGAVLLSVHQNSFSDPSYSGAQVFYSPTEGSCEWGVQTQEILRAYLDPSNARSAKPIPDSVYLMNHIHCTAILVECGFMSNSAESAMLLTADYQKKIAAALAGACIQYLNDSE